MLRRARSAGRVTPQQLDRMAQKRTERFVDFPLGANIVWFGEPVGKVTGYNLERGRVRASNGCDYDPNEIMLTKA